MASLRRLPALAPYLALGPITGPLAAGLVRSVQQRRPLMAGVYGLGILESVVLLPTMFTALLRAAPH